MKQFTRAQFKRLADRGKIHKATGMRVFGENLCESPVEFGVINGYPLADICNFYAVRQGYGISRKIEGWSQKQALQAGYDKFIHDLVHFVGTALKQAPHLVPPSEVPENGGRALKAPNKQAK